MLSLAKAIVPLFFCVMFMSVDEYELVPLITTPVTNNEKAINNETMITIGITNSCFLNSANLFLIKLLFISLLLVILPFCFIFIIFHLFFILFIFTFFLLNNFPISSFIRAYSF